MIEISVVEIAVVEVVVAEIIAIDDRPAVGDVGVVVVNNSVVVPIVSPVVPTPAITAEEPNSKTKTKRDSRASKVQSWIRIPAGPDADGRTIDEPGIILRHVDNLRVRGLDHNGLPLVAYLFLR